jgi:ATP-dependent DNA ligase
VRLITRGRYDWTKRYPWIVEAVLKNRSMRKANLQRLLVRLFRKACEFGLEGLVSKHLDRPYQGGRSKHWIKVKNRAHQAFDRVKASFA